MKSPHLTRRVLWLTFFLGLGVHSNPRPGDTLTRPWGLLNQGARGPTLNGPCTGLKRDRTSALWGRPCTALSVQDSEALRTCHSIPRWALPQHPILERWPQLRASWGVCSRGAWALVEAGPEVQGPGHTSPPSPGVLGPLPAQSSAFPSFLSPCQGRSVTHPHPQRRLVLNPTGSRGICQQQLPPEPAP